MESTYLDKCEQTKKFSFKEMSVLCNRYLNFLRKHGLHQNDVIFSQMPLLPENWLTIMVSIKGGFHLIPAATVLSVHDIVYRFGKLMPAAVVADPDNAAKIDEAEVLAGKFVPVKIVVNGTRKGWISFNDVYEENNIALAGDTNADDPLFLFFTSGTTGMPKVVTHTHFSYPFGHLTTASWIGLKRAIYIIIFLNRAGQSLHGVVSLRHGVLEQQFLLFIKQHVLMQKNIYQ